MNYKLYDDRNPVLPQDDVANGVSAHQRKLTQKPVAAGLLLCKELNLSKY